MTDSADATRRTERAVGDQPAPRSRDQSVRPWRLAAWVVVLALVVGGVATLPGYGVTCDEAYGYLFFGERYLHYFLTHDRAYLDFQNADLPIHRREPNLFASIGRVHPRLFPPLADTLSAGTMELLGHRLGWMDPIDGFHVATILLVGLLLAALFEFAAPRIGSADRARGDHASRVPPALLGGHAQQPEGHPGARLLRVDRHGRCALVRAPSGRERAARRRHRGRRAGDQGQRRLRPLRGHPGSVALAGHGPRVRTGSRTTCGVCGGTTG